MREPYRCGHTAAVEVRPASVADADEIVRLAGVMFTSMGMEATDASWVDEARRHIRERLGHDLAVFVVDHPTEAGRLAASAAGTILTRLPTPPNPSARAGYVQWVCTDDEQRGQGLGRSVMAALMEWFDERGVLTVELHATPMAEVLYRSLGFTDEGPPALRRRAW
jgi:GNAT superfamily N-acetyltransferase